jgi:hypothetical protein
MGWKTLGGTDSSASTCNGATGLRVFRMSLLRFRTPNCSGQCGEGHSPEE